jgi:hypothetical protein
VLSSHWLVPYKNLSQKLPYDIQMFDELHSSLDASKVYNVLLMSRVGGLGLTSLEVTH